LDVASFISKFVELLAKSAQITYIPGMTTLHDQILGCRLCTERFAATRTAHWPRPVPWFRPSARLLIAGQAPGARVHESGKPFDDASGDRLRDWLGVDRDTFYDLSRIACVPMAFCFPGYDAKGSDLPPPAMCRQTWHEQVIASMPDLRLRVLVGGYAQAYHLGAKTNVTETVKAWRDHLPETLPLPHPSWRNTAWLRRNPWFETELIPILRARVQEALT
jgi:uracil-DNA glycosylase